MTGIRVAGHRLCVISGGGFRGIGRGLRRLVSGVRLLLRGTFGLGVFELLAGFFEPAAGVRDLLGEVSGDERVFGRRFRRGRGLARGLAERFGGLLSRARGLGGVALGGIRFRLPHGLGRLGRRLARGLGFLARLFEIQRFAREFSGCLLEFARQLPRGLGQPLLARLLSRLPGDRIFGGFFQILGEGSLRFRLVAGCLGESGRLARPGGFRQFFGRPCPGVRGGLGGLRGFCERAVFGLFAGGVRFSRGVGGFPARGRFRPVILGHPDRQLRRLPRQRRLPFRQTLPRRGGLLRRLLSALRIRARSFSPAAFPGGCSGFGCAGEPGAGDFPFALGSRS